MLKEITIMVSSNIGGIIGGIVGGLLVSFFPARYVLPILITLLGVCIYFK
jgi:hypothetical protein